MARSNDLWPLPEDLPSEFGQAEAPRSDSIRVLVVDDNPLNQMLISTLMETRGFVPMLAADGAEAVALACELHFDLILMDLQMPILDGMAATSEIRRMETASLRPAVPVIAYSSCAPGGGLLARCGFNGSLIKPCGDQDLEDCLVRWCPTYRAASTVRIAHLGNSLWQSSPVTPGTSSASLR
jgi:CheY-like chemotaxis protein